MKYILSTSFTSDIITMYIACCTCSKYCMFALALLQLSHMGLRLEEFLFGYSFCLIYFRLNSNCLSLHFPQQAIAVVTLSQSCKQRRAHTVVIRK